MLLPNQCYYHGHTGLHISCAHGCVYTCMDVAVLTGRAQYRPLCVLYFIILAWHDFIQFLQYLLSCWIVVLMTKSYFLLLMNSSLCNHSWFTGILVILVFHNEFLFRKIKCFSEREIIRGKEMQLWGSLIALPRGEAIAMTAGDNNRCWGLSPCPHPKFQRLNPGPAPVWPGEQICFIFSTKSRKWRASCCDFCCSLCRAERCLTWYLLAQNSAFSHLLIYPGCFLMSYEHGYSGNWGVILHVFGF